MKTKEKTIRDVAKEALTCYEWKPERKTYISKDNDLWREWVRDMTFEAHGDLLPDDYIYNWIAEVLDLFAYSGCETEEQAENNIYEVLEADIYTASLTAWLASNINRVYYLDEAISEGAKDGFQLLAMAQLQEKQEVARIVLNHLVKRIEE